jgi:uncharacterized membrane protein YidH (DUF202 family)
VRSPQQSRPATKMTALTLVAIGIGLVVLALIADQIDLGGGKGFGYQQLIALIIGLGLILAGGGILVQTRGGRGSSGNGFELER